MGDAREIVAVGELVYLARPAPADRTAFLDLAAESRAFLEPWMDAVRAVETDGGDGWFDTILREAAAGRSEKLFIFRPEDDALLGALNCNEIVRGSFQSAYLGYFIGERHARQGYMADALRTLLRYAFEDLGLHRVEANIQPENEASIALVAGAGFVKEGFSPRYLRIGGLWRDHQRWALTIEDWQEG